jgi:DUF2075 family protein
MIAFRWLSGVPVSGIAGNECRQVREVQGFSLSSVGIVSSLSMFCREEKKRTS